MACGWEASYAGCSGDQEFIDSVDEDTKRLAEEMATDLLDRWTGGLYGVCPVTVRPCRAFRQDPHRALRDFTQTTTGTGSGSPWMPVLIGGRWINIGCGQCGGRCSCVDGARALSLPWPIDSVDAVTIDGATLPEDAYRVDAQRLLVRTDGGTWPLTQNLDADVTEPDTFAVTYQRGTPVPAGGKIAAGVLAMELMKALCDDGSCQLPQRVQTVTRQGVTVAMLDSFEGLEDGRTGIWLVDSWVSSVTKPRRPAAVYSVDLPRARR